MSWTCWKRCQCRKRCDGFFPHNIEMRNGCRSWCENNKKGRPEQYLKGLCMNDPTGLLLRYNYDVCTDDDITIDTIRNEYQDPSLATNQRNMMFFAGLLLIIFIYLVTKK